LELEFGFDEVGVEAFINKEIDVTAVGNRGISTVGFRGINCRNSVSARRRNWLGRRPVRTLLHPSGRQFEQTDGVRLGKGNQ
jgi:hypothetical protein